MRDPEVLLSNSAKLHEKVSKAKEPPKDTDEFQMSVIQSRLQTAIVNLTYDGCSLFLIEVSLFYFWFKIESLIHKIDDDIFEKKATDINFKIQIIEIILKQALNTKDDGPTRDMKDLGQNVQLMKDEIQGMNPLAISNVEREKQIKKVNQAIWEASSQCMKDSISPIDIAGMLLYYWYRNWNIIRNESEDLFQKVERNWPEIYGKIREELK